MFYTYLYTVFIYYAITNNNIQFCFIYFIIHTIQDMSSTNVGQLLLTEVIIYFVHKDNINLLNTTIFFSNEEQFFKFVIYFQLHIFNIPIIFIFINSLQIRNLKETTIYKDCILKYIFFNV